MGHLLRGLPNRLPDRGCPLTLAAAALRLGRAGAEPAEACAVRPAARHEPARDHLAARDLDAPVAGRAAVAPQRCADLARQAAARVVHGPRAPDVGAAHGW